VWRGNDDRWKRIKVALVKGRIRVDIRVDPIRVDNDLDPLDRKLVTFEGHLILTFGRGRIEREIDRGMRIEVERIRNRVENGQIALPIVKQAGIEFIICLLVIVVVGVRFLVRFEVELFGKHLVFDDDVWVDDALDKFKIDVLGEEGILDNDGGGGGGRVLHNHRRAHWRLHAADFLVALGAVNRHRLLRLRAKVALVVWTLESAIRPLRHVRSAVLHEFALVVRFELVAPRIRTMVNVLELAVKHPLVHPQTLGR